MVEVGVRAHQRKASKSNSGVNLIDIYLPFQMTSGELSNFATSKIDLETAPAPAPVPEPKVWF
jgi:hypothetical protein